MGGAGLGLILLCCTLAVGAVDVEYSDGYYDGDEAYYVDGDGEEVTDYPVAGDYEAYYDYGEGEGAEYVEYYTEEGDTEHSYRDTAEDTAPEDGADHSDQEYEEELSEDVERREEDVSEDVVEHTEHFEEEDNVEEESYSEDDDGDDMQPEEYDEAVDEEEHEHDSDSEHEEERYEDDREEETETYDDVEAEEEVEEEEDTAYDEEEGNENYDEAETETEAESEYEDEDMDTLYRNYEILSEFYQKHYVDLRVLDETCEPSAYPAPVIAHGIVRRYERVANVLLPGKQYRQAVYSCNSGYVLSDRTSDSMFCQEYAWTGLEPECEKSDGWTEAEQGTDECDEGFRMTSGGCEDVDECREDNGGCDEDCLNKPGSYMCSCPAGWELGEDGHECVDSDECVGNNGHGPCQDTCLNTQGSYYCSCDTLPGAQLGSDGHSCELRDMCEAGSCSHGCYSAQGRAYCTCPEGLQLGDDWSTCRDIDECELGSPCEDTGATCVNTPGSYTCEHQAYDDGEDYEEEEDYDDGEEYADPDCGPGYELRAGECAPVCREDTCGGHGECSAAGGELQCECHEGYEGAGCAECGPGYRRHGDTCVDIDECYEEEPCDTAAQLCANTRGGYTCSCRDGFTQVPGGDGGQIVCRDIDECGLRPAICQHGCVNSPGGFRCSCRPGHQPDPADSTKCVAAGCPALAAPEGGVLHCSEGALVAGAVCRLECGPGRVRMGRARRRCLESGTWEEGSGWCQQVSCPPLAVQAPVTVAPPSCLTHQQSFKSKCRLSCPPGHRFQGSRAAFCGKTNKWIFRAGPARCVPSSPPPSYSQIPAPAPPPARTTPAPAPASPYIVCPPDISLNLSSAGPLLVTIPRPKTNLDWEENVAASPPSAKSLSFYQEAGDREVQFEATNPVSKQTAICRVKVHVRDVAKPTVTYCPQSRSVFLEPGQASQKVFWSEPTFQDNVKIEAVIASALPGGELSLGKHVIVYQATDQAGNREKCVFSITVVQFQQEDSARKWVLCRVGNTGRQIRLLVTAVPPGCRQINIAQPPQ